MTTSITTSIYGVTDGYTLNANVTSWATCRSAASSTNVYNAQTSNYVGTHYPSLKYNIYRPFIPFNTNGLLPTGATITSATLYIWSIAISDLDNDGKDFVTVVQGTPTTPTSIVVGDYSKVGSTEGIDSGSRKDLTGLGTSAYLSFALNATGISWINNSGYTVFALREGHDLLDEAPVNNNYWAFAGAATAGTTNDAYLEITYTMPDKIVPVFDFVNQKTVLVSVPYVVAGYPRPNFIVPV